MKTISEQWGKSVSGCFDLVQEAEESNGELKQSRSLSGGVSSGYCWMKGVYRVQHEKRSFAEGKSKFSNFG